jgi:hypothetical protein
VPPPASLRFDETGARQVLLLQAVESAPPGPLWTADDADWATRQALQSAGGDGPAALYVAERARLALQRLLPRDPLAARWLAWRGWRPAWLAWAALAGLALGVAADSLGGAAHINLLAPPVWTLLAWNLAAYALLLGSALRGGVAAPAGRWRGALARGLAAGRPPWRPAGGAPAVAPAATAWAGLAAPLLLARAAALLHMMAAALALGVLLGLYLRGLVLDIRVGWQSTFLSAASVQALLGAGLAPARALTGIALPSVDAIAALRLQPGAAPAASAAPWIHLYAATMALGVIVPRLLLAGLALLQAHRAAGRLDLPLAPYFQRLLRRRHGGQALVQVRPHAAPVSAPAALGLRSLLATAYGPALQLRLAEPAAFGDEDTAAAAEAGAALQVALFDLAATPEADSQGRFVQALRQAAPGVPLLMAVDEAGFARRFGALADRMAERRAAWQRLADDLGAALLCVDLERADPAPDAARLDHALARAAAG